MDKNEVERFEHNGYTIRIIQDTDANDPREDCDEVGTMVCWHSSYKLGDEQRRDDPDEFLESLAEGAVTGFIDRWENYHFRRMVPAAYSEVGYKAQRAAYQKARLAAMWKVIDANYVMLPLGLIDHSGISMYVGSGAHACDPGGWDSGQVGWIYCTREKAIEEWGGKAKRFTKHVREKAENYLRIEVKRYDQYLRGDVYGYVIETPDGDHVDSCWGFYGADCCKEEAIGNVPEEAALKGGESEDEMHEETLI